MKFLSKVVFRLTPWVVCVFFLISANISQAESAAVRERSCLDEGWRFHLGDDWPDALRLDKAGSSGGPAGEKFTDDAWRELDLPHDWAIELPFDSQADTSHGFKPVGPGFPRNSMGWYRRQFVLSPEDAGRRIWLTFDGVFQSATVWVNGWLVTRHEGGYYPFRCDITDIVRFGGTNLISVKVDATKFEGWFYEGAGIYRHVWLEKTAPVALAPDGVFVWPDVKPDGAGGIDAKAPVTIHLEARVKNFQTNTADVTMHYRIVAPDGSTMAVTPDALMDQGQLVPEGDKTFTQSAQVANPVWWSPEDPKLYQLVAEVENGGQTIDRVVTEFGIRSVGFDKDKGFLLNGHPYELKGTCNHQDMAGVGSALPDALQYFRVKKLKEFGCNAIRTSHNPPTPELLQACDHLGMLIMDECRLLGSDEQNLTKWDTQIRRDRNHPCVAIWSIANEEFSVQTTPQAANVARTMQRYVKRLDPTRPVTYAAPQGDTFDGINGVIEVRGWNYHPGPEMDSYHAKHPDQPNVGTEQASTVSTRGIYFNDPARGYVSAYDTNHTEWSTTAEGWWSVFDPRPWLSGGFVWTGFDYRGEPTPYAWPCINSHFGILDTCGFPKDNFYYYQSWWTTNVVLHLLPHWNWPGMEGKKIRVDALSNCKQVELFLNGASQGKQEMKKDSKLTWMVKYAPGTLSAKGYDAAGKVMAETKVQTTGEPVALQLTPDRPAITADGKDVSVFTVSAVDAKGLPVPVATNLVHFGLKGAGKILGVGNGDPSCHEPDTFVVEPVSKVLAADDWRWRQVDLSHGEFIDEYAPDYDDSAWQKTSSAGEFYQLAEGQTAVFRQHVTLTADDLKNALIQLRFGTIDDRGWIYVNGRRAGMSRSYDESPVFPIKQFLHAGDNVIAVGVQNIGGPGGIVHGVTMEMVSQPPASGWSRSLFNGLAQIMVQSTKEAGAMQLTASADGLKPVAATIQTTK